MNIATYICIFALTTGIVSCSSLSSNSTAQGTTGSAVCPAMFANQPLALNCRLEFTEVCDQNALLDINECNTVDPIPSSSLCIYNIVGPKESALKVGLINDSASLADDISFKDFRATFALANNAEWSMLISRSESSTFESSSDGMNLSFSTGIGTYIRRSNFEGQGTKITWAVNCKDSIQLQSWITHLNSVN